MPLAHRAMKAHNCAMKMLCRLMPVLMPILLIAGGVPALAGDSVAGRYRLDGDHDAAGELLLRADGRFEYALAYGALDEHAQGRWARRGEGVVLTTEPKPVPPLFRMAARSKPAAGAPTLRVSWPDGRGVAGVDFRIGFDTGDPVTDYTQDAGWTLPAEDHRVPRWIELVEPIYGIVSPRYPIDTTTRGTLNFVIVPNDIGVVDFSGMAVDVQPDRLIIHRGQGEMRFVRQSGAP